MKEITVTYIEICQSIERQQRIKKMKELPLEELKSLVGDAAMAEQIFESFLEAKEGYMRIQKLFPNMDEPKQGWTYCFAAGLPLHLDSMSYWYSTSNIKSIDWDSRVFETLNSKYSFEFLQIGKTIEYAMNEIYGWRVGPGWAPLLQPILLRIEQLNEDGANIQITDVKEKWGLLKVYADGATDEVYAMIDDAEEKSAHICQDCGAPAETIMSTTGWYYTLCPACLAKRGIKISDPDNAEIDE